MRRRMRATVVALVLLGSGLLTSEPASAASTPIIDALSVTGGGFHNCARLGNGQARCWGAGVSGQLGRNSTVNASQAIVVKNPTDTAPQTGVREIITGQAHTCARVFASNQVRCWGANNLGQLGDTSTTNRLLPVTVEDGAGPLTGITQLTAGFTHTCALRSSGQVVCWGGNADGQLGNGTTTPSSAPVPVQNVNGTGPLTAVTQISAQRHHTCARQSSGQVRCWGEGAGGRLGNTLNTDATRPVIVTSPSGTGALTGVRHVNTGGTFSCAVLTSGQVRCWGANNEGQIGDGTSTTRLLPRSVLLAPTGLLRNVATMTSGFSHSCARLTTGKAYCWGRGAEGQQGDGTFTLSRRAGPVQNDNGDNDLVGIATIEAGDFHTCVTTTTRRVRCWGDNSLGALGNGTSGTNWYYPVIVGEPA